MEELRDEREERVKEEQRVIMINPTKTTVCHKVLSLAQQEQSKERVQQEGDQRETGKKFKKAHKNSVHLFYFSTHCDFYKLPWQSWGSGLADRQGGGPERGPQVLELSLQHTTPGSRCDEITGAGRPVLEQEGSDGSAGIKSVCRVGKRKKRATVL